MVSLRSPIARWHRRSCLMANPKRVSMREGPLAALFRKTEELEGDASTTPPPQPDAATPVGEQQATAGASDIVAGAGATRAPAQSEHPRDSGVPHPSLHPGVEIEED